MHCVVYHYLFSISVHPSVYVGVCDGSATYHKWYFEVQVTQLSASTREGEGLHFRVGWAHVTLFLPTPTSNSSTTTGTVHVLHVHVHVHVHVHMCYLVLLNLPFPNYGQ